ncbi:MULTISPECIES: hypothetical protein [Enterobacterales]|uniref:hypothetical protein n=1 Tax=Enterobacterales TaxID=91347 RepID=UPI0008481BE0|nr:MULTISPECIES: hypothetical protein [Enterobacterales]WOO51475.1 hypothetical protein R2S03_10050 [Hafnia alvei]MCK9782707.1 hypothetical protein [Proteus columbae]ODQ04638.1 hypothetical protein BGK50_06170 [Shigella sp. FC130]OEI92171.1 hypothetical protein BHE86_07660 [Shigella sp. FC1655]WPF05948.1 hypothetical protein SB028_08900 [Proteus vulgaris]
MHRSFYLTTILCATTLTAGCEQRTNLNSQSGVFYISNNKTTPLVFQIDNNSFWLNTGEVKEIKLENGKHVLVDAEGKKKTFMIYSGNHGGIINPAKEVYYSFTSNFSPKEDNEPLYLTMRSVWIDGQLVHGAINSSDAIFIDNNVFRCDVPLNEPIPTYLPDWSNKGGINVLTKCFSQTEFQDFISRKPYGIHVYSGRNLLEAHKEKDKYNWIDDGNTRTDDFIPTLSHIEFNNRELLKEAKSIYKVTNSYLASRDPNEKQNYYNEYHFHIMIMAMVYSQQIQNDIFDDKEAYFKLINETGRIFGAGILSEPALI